MENKEELEEKVIHINRCSKVVKGGRTFSFSALIVVGDKNGRVGYGFAKANEVSDAIKKATETAKKSVFTFERHGTTIPHEILAVHDGAKIFLKPAKKGTGVVAAGKVQQGTIHSGDEVRILGRQGEKRDRVISLAMRKRPFAIAGEAVGLVLKTLDKDDVERGDRIEKVET